MSKEESCAERVRPHWLSRKADLEAFMKNPNGDGDTGPFHEYALSFDYVPAGTFKYQRRGYWRYQISWGGPSDEIRMWGDDRGMTSAEYWFLDWFDGASVKVEKEACVKWLWDTFSDTGALRAAVRSAA